MAREAVRLPEPQTPQEEAIERALAPIFERFAALVADAERNKLAAWMMAQGYATGHGDSIEDLLKELEWQIRESEREACAKVVEDYCGAWDDKGYALASAIRARGNT
jgi:hypothetical protein